MPVRTLTQVRNRINSFLTDLWPKIVTRQNTYFTNHGRYWQGIKTFVPDGEADTDPTPDLTLKPHDQAESWQAAGFHLDLPTTLPCGFQINTYNNGADGKGWVGLVWVVHRGTTYCRTKGFNMPASFDRDWFVVK